MKALCVSALLFAGSAMGQIGVAHHVPDVVGEPGPRPTAGTLLDIDMPALRAALAGAPLERLDAAIGEYGSPLTLVDPAGRAVECFVAESPVMEPALAAKFPGMRTYIVRSIDGTRSGRIEVTQRGVTGMIRATLEGEEAAHGGAWMIDPWQARDDAHAISYWLRDLPGGGDWTCHTQDDGSQPFPPSGNEYDDRVAQSRRVYRLAMACTGEYGAFHSALQGHEPNVADPLAAIVTVVARSNVVYEADLGVHFDLVANNDLLIFTNGDTDPYPSTCGGNGGTDCSGAVLGENPGVVNAAIGSANYDIGHCVTRIFGGVAYLRAVCTNNKAGGVSGIPRGGDADPFSALVVIHEMGHQFGANHTFNGTRGRCAGNVNLSTAWEAGSGSSPMAYAGGCPVGDAPPSDNIVQFADPFFHHGSITEMKNFLAAGGSTCAAITVTANEVPVITVPSTTEYIPPATPFVLVASATDANNDVLSYSWEQFDSGFARPLVGDGAFDNGQGALFRIFPPVASSSRVFPKIADVLAGVASAGEMLPTVTGVTRRFRCIVRDNNPAAGAVAISSFVDLTIPAGTSRFALTSPLAGERITSGPRLVTWTVGGTNAAPTLATSVLVDLSLDDGATWPITLGTFVNNGAATVTLPSATSANARLRLRPTGKIFFAVSPRFHLGCPSDYTNDGSVDGDDVIAFFGLWDANNAEADINLDGGVDGDDIIVFFGRWDSGC